MGEVKVERQWTYDMYRRVLYEYPIKGDALADEMGISIANLRERASQLDITVHKDFTEEEDDLFRKYSPKLKGAMLFLMPYRSPAEIALHK